MDPSPKPDWLDWLLVSDVDDTLAGDEGALAEFSKHTAGLRLILNSSRPRASVLRTVAGFPPALRIDGCITAMGTEILLGGADLAEWQKTFDGWQRDIVDETMDRLPATPHPDEFQTPFKASYALHCRHWPDAIHAIAALDPPCRIITSGNSDVDVIPAAAGKDNATLWIARHLGIPRHRLIVAGDSANDLAMFRAADMAIAVGNARRELTDHAPPATTFFSTQPRALGLLQGLRHWGALPTP